jgi:molybdenum cofactor synthesis domain-containing protein
MDAAIVTVGDELLAGDTVDTNAAWLASAIADRGGRVRRVLTVPDDREVVADAVREYAASYDAVLVTGGVGGTADDVTMPAVADALDRDLAVDDEVRETQEHKWERYAAENPDLVERHDFDATDRAAWASLPEGARPLLVQESFGAGCVAENVYVFPGIPGEMQAMFALVADDFAGNVVARYLHTPTPEGALTATLDDCRERFDVAVGSYPNDRDDPVRVKVTGTDADAVAAATDWLRERIAVVDASEDD